MNFLTDSYPYAAKDQIGALVQYLLSIDEQAEYPALPAVAAPTAA